ncbi:unnamed protein product [Sphenostylis stenocarpa]|uniref:Uncharacterized protein n=1 Tax=Sphenostylis stenocarpa TaxID=92480 RepID=A0AA86W246_9FABA|nr:unnamed protein product [Sphenostylis stenocarpa]
MSEEAFTNCPVVTYWFLHVIGYDEKKCVKHWVIVEKELKSQLLLGSEKKRVRCTSIISRVQYTIPHHTRDESDGYHTSCGSVTSRVKEKNMTE